MPKSRFRPSASRAAALTLAAVTALPLGLVCAPTAAADSIPATAAPSAQVSCRPQTELYGAATDGPLKYYAHADPANGSFNWPVINKQIGGGGWQAPRLTLGGAGGWFYSINSEGNLFRYRYDPAANSGEHDRGEKIDDGWGAFIAPARRNRVTVDDRGNIFAVFDDGSLRFYQYDQKTGAVLPGRGRIIDPVGWGEYDLIVAAGDGLIFARKGGDLYRYRFDVDRQQWLDVKVPAWAVGWQNLREIRSAGGGTLYALHQDGTLFWYRWDQNAGAWVDTSRRKSGWGFQVFQGIAMRTDACHAPAEPEPAPVTPRPRIPAAVRQGKDQLIQQFYVDERGWLIQGTQREINDIGTVVYTVVPGAQNMVDQPVVTEQADGTPMAFVLGKDGHIYMTKRQPGATWSPLTDLGGNFAAAPTVLRNSKGMVAVHAFGRDGKLWYLNQRAANSEDFIPWRTQDAYSPVAAGYEQATFAGASQATVVDGESDRPFVLGIDKQGRLGVNRADDQRNGWWVWGVSDVTGLTGTPVAARGADGRMMAFARNKDGEIWAANESARSSGGKTLNGFFGDGAVIPGVKTDGSPVVVVNKDKTLGVVVRDDKGYVRYAAQRPDGSFGGWSLVWSGKAATDPSIVQLGDGRWGVFFLDTEGVERMYWLSAANGSTALAAPGARTKRSIEPESRFTGGPTAKQGAGRPTANTAAK
ncbi:tachylectin-related carbohydrate-binding protein [Streptomyces olivoreticuli]|uniref:tachylectin-related carbohydrate-binding protein n=1 Tax=Streptomyces olivoreticuli TaxID=68246 RepID=UPI002657D715|nr:tachylectin-related carbohydrate-binding protein [Streptomyces olivoreticuli]WKK25278.1 tachylectin-related carbohydrate-binding protein [Streptomyces olivoreticuli]